MLPYPLVVKLPIRITEIHWETLFASMKATVGSYARQSVVGALVSPSCRVCVTKPDELMLSS
jgi:hypothetical protein